MNEIHVFVRPLTRQDAAISCLWRNDPDVWRFTGKKPDRVVTVSMEEAWYDAVSRDPARRNFAICAQREKVITYVGNAYLTDISKVDAQLHIFIGNKEFWGKGVGTATTKALLVIAQNELHLRRIWLMVQQDNNSAISVYKKVGFVVTEVDPMKMEIFLRS